MQIWDKNKNFIHCSASGTFSRKVGTVVPLLARFDHGITREYTPRSFREWADQLSTSNAQRKSASIENPKS